MQHRGRTVLAAGFVALVVLAPGLLTPAAAAAPNGPATGGLSVVPNPKSTHTNPAHTSVRVGTLLVGRVFTETATVVNSTSKPIDVYVYPADGVPARGGGYGYATRGTTMTGVGAWTRVSVGRAIVPANGRVPITLRLQAPVTATNGFHLGAVVAEPVQTKAGGPIVTVTRYAMPVSVMTTGGVAPSAAPSKQPSGGTPTPIGGPLEVTDLDPHQRGSHACPTVRVTNRGATPAGPRLTVTSDGWLGGSTRTTTVSPVPAGESKVVQLPCVRRPFGPGTLRVTADGLPTVAAHLFWLPLVLLLSLLLLLLLIGALVTTFVRGWLERREPPAAPEASISSQK
jgi:hypothetical protein